MDATIFSFLLVLLQLICVIFVASFLTRSRFSIDIPDSYHAVKTQFLRIFVLCNIWICGMICGIKMTGALVNVRDFGQRVVRFIGRLVVGPSVGLNGEVYRRFSGGVTVIPCVLVTILTTGSGGFIWPWHIQNFCGVCLKSEDITQMVTRVK